MAHTSAFCDSRRPFPTRTRLSSFRVRVIAARLGQGRRFLPTPPYLRVSLDRDQAFFHVRHVDGPAAAVGPQDLQVPDFGLNKGEERVNAGPRGRRAGGEVTLVPCLHAGAPASDW